MRKNSLLRPVAVALVAGLYLSVSILLTLAPILPVAYAGDSTLTYTTAQSNSIRTRLIPRYNVEHCAKFGLPGTCSSLDLVTAGCVPIVVKTITIEACAIFTSNAAGEQAFLQEVANIEVVTVFNRLIREGNLSYNARNCALWRVMTAGQRDTECNRVGEPAGCEGPCP